MRREAKDRSSEMVRASLVRYIVVVCGLALVILILVTAMWPWPYYAAVERYLLPEYEGKFGFRWGRVEIRVGDASQTVGVLVAVSPGGRMAKAGARAGDIPVAYQSAAAGEAAEFEVVASSEWPDWSKRRRITLLPTGENRDQEPSR
jgi:hypothetical protein